MRPPPKRQPWESTPPQQTSGHNMDKEAAVSVADRHHGQVLAYIGRKRLPKDVKAKAGRPAHDGNQPRSPSRSTIRWPATRRRPTKRPPELPGHRRDPVFRQAGAHFRSANSSDILKGHRRRHPARPAAPQRGGNLRREEHRHKHRTDSLAGLARSCRTQDSCTIDVYMGGGCALPGAATVLMPGQGYEGVPSS